MKQAELKELAHTLFMDAFKQYEGCAKATYEIADSIRREVSSKLPDKYSLDYEAHTNGTIVFYLVRRYDNIGALSASREMHTI